MERLLNLFAAQLNEQNRQDEHELLTQIQTTLEAIYQSTRETRSGAEPDRAQLLSEAFSATREGIALLTPSGIVEQGNAAFLAMASGKLHSPIGHPLANALQFDLSHFSETLERVASGIPWSGKATSRADGERSFWISLSHSTAFNANSPQIIALVSDVTEANDTEKRLRLQALHDKLTGLPNRRFFCDHLDELIVELKATGGGADVCFIDLDDFKHVNDCTGHANGDIVLEAMGHRIRNAMGPGAFVARFGGDEFAIVLADQNKVPGEVMEPYQRLLLEFREPFALQNAEAFMSASIGITRFPDHASDIEGLLANADAAMYAAKSAGKNQIRMFSSELQAHRAMQRQVQDKLRRALEDGEIELWFQPKIYAIDGTSAGCEALARWKTPGGDYIPPGSFVPVAEQTGLISPLGNKVFQLAAEQACRWHADGLSPDIAVNVSPQQLRHPRFVKQLQSILDSTQALATWFELEITENAVMADVAQAAAVIDELGSLGFRIAIDDFGTGHSSLSYLKTFNIHTLKIDLSFVRDLMRDDSSNAIVRSIISLGTGLNLTLVAEGVETSAQANFLTESGCDILQGYLFGKPMPSAEYQHWHTTRYELS